MIGVKLNFQDISTNVRISNADHHLRQEFEASEKITRRGTRLAPVARGSLAFKQGETDMNTKQIVLDSYTAANEDQRLGLYMFHRELRDELTKS